MYSYKDVQVPMRDAHLNTDYNMISRGIEERDREHKHLTNRGRNINGNDQCNLQGDLCTCRKLGTPKPRCYSSPRQVYRYLHWRSSTDIGVDGNKIPRKRIRKYLPETIDRAVGSGKLTPHIKRTSRQKWTGSYFENKETSKLVDGFVKDDNISLVNKKMSPIIQKKSGSKSPSNQFVRDKDHIANNDLQKRKSPICAKVKVNKLKRKSGRKAESEVSKTKHNRKSKQILEGENSRYGEPTVTEELKSVVVNHNTGTCKDILTNFSVQHEHNLKNSSDVKESVILVDPAENKLEVDFKKKISKSNQKPSAAKPVPDFKSTSLLRRRFKALRFGLEKKSCRKESFKITSQTKMASLTDVYVASNPLHLEQRPCLNTKAYSPYNLTTNEYMSHEKISNKQRSKGKKNKNNLQWSLKDEYKAQDKIPRKKSPKGKKFNQLGDSKYESAQGLFKLRGKKYTLDEDRRKTSLAILNDLIEEKSITESKEQVEFVKKKHGRKFFNFKRKSKENKVYKSQKEITADRSEVKDGLTIKMGGANSYFVKDLDSKQQKRLETHDGILRKSWLDKYITNTRDSMNTHIRWNNKMYSTSSSTVLELMDSVYKHTGIGIHFRSRSEITTGQSANHNPYTKQRVNFMHQDVETWLMPKVTATRQSFKDRTNQSNNKCRRWFVDALKTFSQKIELVLQSKSNSKTSEYIVIHIPEGYFIHSNSDLRAQSSDEKIYKIVEYDTSDSKKIKKHPHMATGDNVIKDEKVKNNRKMNDTKEKTRLIPVTDPENIEKLSSLRDVAIQGSNVIVTKRCDVIGVGIITQRDRRDVRRPILKIEDEVSDEESEEIQSICQKNCQLAESYLQEYCRNWFQSDIGMFSWYVNDSHDSGDNSVASIRKGEIIKSYPNKYDNFRESTVLLSCEESTCRHCIGLEDEKLLDDSKKKNFLSKFKKKPSETRMISDKRNHPKNSLEVFKRRQFYACNNQKVKWFKDDIDSNPCMECAAKAADNQKLHKPCWNILDGNKTKKQNKQKRVSLPSCEEMRRLLNKLSNRSLEGILSYKESSCSKQCSPNSPKTAKILTGSTHQIPLPPCKETCEVQKRPPCLKKKLSSFDQLHQQPVNVKTSIPQCEMTKSASSETPPLCAKPVKKLSCSACKSQRRMSKESLHRNHLPSQKSGLSLTMSPRASPKQSDACFPRNTNKQEKQKECMPSCANKKVFLKKLMNIPITPPPTACQMPLGDYSKGSKEVTGLHLKKLPYKKKPNSYDCYDHDGLIRLNSKEKLTIQMRKVSPSMEDIGEKLNIKVQDENGQTLIERIDYKKSETDNKCLLLKDVYKDPQIQRVSTPLIIQSAPTENKSQNELHEEKSDVSIDTVIEINLTLKMKQGDKNTGIHIKSYGDAEIRQNIVGKDTESQHFFIVQSPTKPEPVANENKKDVNINILIKNHNSDPEKCDGTETYTIRKADDDLCNKRISEKFQTVSTGYSDIDQQEYSIHRATVDLSKSVDKCGTRSRIGSCVASKELVNILKKIMTPSQNVIVHSVCDENKEVSVTKRSSRDCRNSKTMSFEDTNKFIEKKCEQCALPQNHLEYTVLETSDESVWLKKIAVHDRTGNEAILKNVYRSSNAVKKSENKKIIKELPREILTSDNSGTDIAVTSHEFIYGSLDPCCFRDIGSINNQYAHNCEPLCSKTEHRHNPTKIHREMNDNDSEISSVDEIDINLPDGCCCKEITIKDEENDKDHLSDLKACMNVKTNKSKHILKKSNSADISIRSETQSIVIVNSVTPKNIFDELDSIRQYPEYLNDPNNLKYSMKNLKRQAVLGTSDTDMLVLNSNIVKKSVTKCMRKKKPNKTNNNRQTADILQSNEAKRAVLEIYKEIVNSDDGENFVVKLPKFDVETENEISNYEDVVAGRKTVK